MAEKVRLTGLWRAESKDGRVYWSGSLGPVKVLMFANDRGGERAPEFTLYLAESEREGRARAFSAGDSGRAAAGSAGRTAARPEPDVVPF